MKTTQLTRQTAPARDADRRPDDHAGDRAETGTAPCPRTCCGWREIDRPAIGDDEVLVRVRAAGVDRGTWHIMAGQPYLDAAAGLRAPRGRRTRCPGWTWPGTVVAVGADVTGFAAGDEVFGIGRGSFAEYAAAPEDKLARKPASLTFEQAAAVAGLRRSPPCRRLRDAGRIQAGQKVLIIGASGGVGTYAVQLAKAFGAEVTGVCSTAKVDLVRSLGADHVIDYTREDFADGGRRYDLILDIGGQQSAVAAPAGAHSAAGRSSSSAARAAGGGPAASAGSSGRCCCRRSSASG